MNIFEELRKDHDRQRDLIRELVQTSGDTEKRQRVFLTLKNELEKHADAEERYFYTELFTNDNTQEKARHSVAEHKELDDYLETLSEKDMSDTGWLHNAKKLEERLLHHLEEEEREVFQMAGKALTEKDKKTLGASYRESMQEQTQ